MAGKFIPLEDAEKLGTVSEQQIKEVQPEGNEIIIIHLPGTEHPIEELLKRKSNVQQLVDCFLFGSDEERMAIESLCLKYTVRHRFKSIQEHISDVIPAYRLLFKTQLILKIYSREGSFYSYEDIVPSLHFKNKGRKGQEVNIKPLPMATLIIKDLSGQNKHLFRYHYHSFNKSLCINKFNHRFSRISMSKWKALRSPRDKSLEVLVLVAPPTIINKPLSVDGTITDTIEHYSRKIQMEKRGFIEGHWSPSFLTHAGGFRVAVFMKLNGFIDIFESGLVAKIRFLSGEFDSQLENKFNHETSVTLINQLDARKNVTVKKQAKLFKNRFILGKHYSYYMKIASRDEINSRGFIVKDSLMYHVTIKPIQ